MYTGKLIFAQLTDFIPRHEFRRCVDRHGGNAYVKTFSCWDQYLSMAFAQLTFRESLRDIEACLRAMEPKLYHMGIRGKISRNTLAHANERRDWRIWADFAQVFIAIARDLYADESFGVELDHTVYALDATTIDLCLSLFPWASFRRSKGGVKMHTLLDLRGNIPVFVRITPAQMHEVNLMDELCAEAGAIYVMDRGYLDFARLYTIHTRPAFFVTRAKRNTKTRRLYSRAVDKTSGPICDQTVQLALAQSLMDQATPADQGLFRHLGQRRQDTDMDRDLRLRTGGDCPETSSSGGQSLHNASSIKFNAFRKNPHKRGYLYS